MDTDTLAKLIKEENEQTRLHFDEKAAEMGRHFDEKAAEMGRHFDVVAESLESKIHVIAEGHGVLVEKIDGLGTRMDHLETKVDHLETKVDGLGTRMDHLETKVDRLDTRMDHLGTKLDGFIVETRANFEEVRASIKFSYAELDRRLTFLESGFKDLSSRMASLEGRQPH